MKKFLKLGMSLVLAGMLGALDCSAAVSLDEFLKSPQPYRPSRRTNTISRINTLAQTVAYNKNVAAKKAAGENVLRLELKCLTNAMYGLQFVIEEAYESWCDPAAQDITSLCAEVETALQMAYNEIDSREKKIYIALCDKVDELSKKKDNSEEAVKEQTKQLAEAQVPVMAEKYALTLTSSLESGESGASLVTTLKESAQTLFKEKYDALKSATDPIRYNKDLFPVGMVDKVSKAVTNWLDIVSGSKKNS